MSVVALGNLNGPAPDSLGAALLALAHDGTATRQAGQRTAASGPEALEDYVGVYDLTPASSVTVSAVNGRLMGQTTGQEAIALDPRSFDVFFQSEADAQLTFTRDASGAVEGLILYQAGRDKVARKK